MKRLALALALLVAAALPADAGFWLQANVTNPAANQVIVTTGALTAQQASFVVYVFSSVAASVAVERVNAGAQAIAADSITFTAPAGQIVQLPMGVTFDAGDTFRVRTPSAVTGNVFAAIRFNDGATPGYCLQGLGCAH